MKTVIKTRPDKSLGVIDICFFTHTFALYLLSTLALMLSDKDTHTPVSPLYTMSQDHNNVFPILDASTGSAYSDPDESFESLIPSDPRLSDFTVLKLLGTGGHSKVFLVQEKVTSRLQALKVISKDEHLGNFDAILSEQRIQAKLSTDDHEYFLPLISSWHDGKNFYLVSEYLGGGDMAFEMIRSRTFDEDRARLYIAEIFIALETLHSQRIIHRDVKPANIMFRADGHIVLGDFGYSKLFDAPTGRSDNILDKNNPPEYVSFDVTADSDSGSFLIEETFCTSEVCGTPYYMAPEQHMAIEYSFEIDYWGMGVILYRMLTARMPFGGDAQNKAEISHSVIHDELRFLEGDNVSPVAQDLLKGLLAKDPSKRPLPQDIKQHPFFKKISWNKAALRQLKTSWIPYISPPPKSPSTNLVIPQGAPYDISMDPFPQFRFTCSKVYQRRPRLVEESKCSPQTFNKTSSFLAGLFKKSSGSKTPPPSKVLRPALRPLILPGLVKELAGFCPPTSIVKKQDLDSGLLSESNYPTLSKHPKASVLNIAPPPQVTVIPLSTFKHGNHDIVDVVDPDAKIYCLGSRPTKALGLPVDLRPAVAFHPPAAPPLTTPFPSAVVLSRLDPAAPIILGSRSTSRSRSRTCAALPGSHAQVLDCRGFSTSSLSHIPSFCRPTPAPSSHSRANGHKDYRGGPPGLPRQYKLSSTALSSTTYIKRPHQTLKNSDRKPEANDSGVHTSVLPNRTTKTSSPTRVHGGQNPSQDRQINIPNFSAEKSRSVSLDRQPHAVSSCVARASGCAQEQVLITKFNLVPNNFLIGRRHPSFLPPTPSAQRRLNSNGLQNVFDIHSTTESQTSISADAKTSRGCPSLSPTTPLTPREASYHVMPVVTSAKCHVENRSNLSAPDSRTSGHPHDAQSIPNVRSIVQMSHTPSTLKIKGSSVLSVPTPPPPVIRENPFEVHLPPNHIRSTPVPPSLTSRQDPFRLVPSESNESPSKDPEGTPSELLVRRLKSWMRRLLGQSYPDPTVRQSLVTPN